MKTVTSVPLENLFFEWYLDELAENSFYNNNASYCDIPYQCDFCHADSLYGSGDYNNNSNIGRRKRGRQTTFHKVGGHPCLRLDLSSLEQDDEVVSLSPPLLPRAPPAFPLSPSPPGITCASETVIDNNLKMGSGASNAKSTSITVVPSTQSEEGVAVTGRERVTVSEITEENSRPQMPGRSEPFISMSGGARKSESTVESINNNAASSSQKPDSASIIEHTGGSGVGVSGKKKLKTYVKPSECTCIPSANKKDSTKPPTCETYSSLEAIFNVEGREVDYVQGDGNCFFRALSKEIYGSEDSHYELRQTIVDLMARHRNEFEQFTDTCTQSFGSHIYEMRQYAVWATTAEIYAASTLLQRDIYVFSPDYTGTDYSWLLFSPCFPRQLDVDSASACPQCYITLCHTNGNHYDRVTPLEGWCNCAIPPPELSGQTKSLSVLSNNSTASLYNLKDTSDSRLDRKNTPGE